MYQGCPWTIDVSHIEGPAITRGIADEIEILDELTKENCSCVSHLIGLYFFEQAEGTMFLEVCFHFLNKENPRLQSSKLRHVLFREAEQGADCIC